MKIRIEIDDKLQESELIIKCAELNDEILEIQQRLTDMCNHETEIDYYKNDTRYYIELKEILFFQTEGSGVKAHTVDDVYEVKFKLYELEDMLPRNFMRISKSAILNLNRIYSITRNITSSSIVEFQNTHKKVYVSRHYYSLLKNSLSKRRR